MNFYNFNVEDESTSLTPYISKMDLDGKNATSIYSKDIYELGTGLIQFTEDSIYFQDTIKDINENEISKMDYEGNVEKIYQGIGHCVYVDNGYLFLVFNDYPSKIYTYYKIKNDGTELTEITLDQLNANSINYTFDSTINYGNWKNS